MENMVLFKSSGIQSEVFVHIFFGITVIIGCVVFFLYRYQQFKRFREFKEELHTLDLGAEEENAFSQMVKQYAMKEPVKILFSLRLYDEMALKEMSRILGSAGSIQAKQQFVNLMYDIRKKTYYKDWGLSHIPQKEIVTIEERERSENAA